VSPHSFRLAPPANPPRWVADPGRHQYRYWDGEKWTDHVSDAGSTSLDPLRVPASASQAERSNDLDDNVEVEHPSGEDVEGMTGAERAGQMQHLSPDPFSATQIVI